MKKKKSPVIMKKKGTYSQIMKGLVMKKTGLMFISILLVLTCMLSFLACGKEPAVVSSNSENEATGSEESSQAPTLVDLLDEDFWTKYVAMDREMTTNPRKSFTERQKQVQKAKGADILGKIKKAAADLSQSSITIPAGDYGFDVATNTTNQIRSSILLENLQRPDDNPFTIYAEGVTFWFETCGNPCPDVIRTLHMVNCSNIKVVGLTMDDYQADDIEGVVTRLDAENNRIAIRVFDGSMVLTSTEEMTRFTNGSECRIVPEKANGDAIAPLYRVTSAWGPGALFINKIESTGTEGEYWITFRTDVLMKTIYTTEWQRTYGSAGTLEVGDCLTLVYGCKFMSLDNCKQITFEGLKDYQTKGGFWENGGYGNHLWKDCYFGPRPGTSQILGAEGNMSQGLRVGSTYDGLTFMMTTDDPINVHGFWAKMTGSSGNRANFDMLSLSVEEGDIVEAYTPEGVYIGSLTVAQTPKKTSYGYNGTLSEPVYFTENIPEEMKAQDVRFRAPNCECNGFAIRNCYFYNAYQRILIQSGSGVIENNVIRNMGSDISLVCSPMGTYEGGMIGEVTIQNNLFYYSTNHPGGAVVGVNFAPVWKGEQKVEKVTVKNNVFVCCGLAAVAKQCKTFLFEDNVILSPIIYGVDANKFEKVMGTNQNVDSESITGNCLVTTNVSAKTGANYRVQIEEDLMDQIIMYARFSDKDASTMIRNITTAVKGE